MLQALCSQRDRFRSKAQELQEALSAAHVRTSTAEAEAAAARADNVALVERLKYVSSYSCVPNYPVYLQVPCSLRRAGKDPNHCGVEKIRHLLPPRTHA